MSSMGLFHKVEMDGKPFLVYTLTQTNNPTSSGSGHDALAIDSSGDHLSPPPPFFCPHERIEFQKLKITMDDDDDDSGKLYPFSSSTHFPIIRSKDDNHEDHDHDDDKSLLHFNHNNFCKLPLVPLFWCNNKETDNDECGACETNKLSTSYYTCLHCQRMFHKECVESPFEIKHPSHPFHSLRLYSSRDLHSCICCGIFLSNVFYTCTTCELSMHPICAMKPIPFVIDHPKSHPHPLTFFPTQDSLVCHICSLIQKLDPTYICIQCVFVIHKDCIGFPLVIRISRHHHRISFTSSLPSGKLLSCGVCRQQVDSKYGAYSCDKCNADYFVHSKCALHPKVWDGKDLDGVPEEDDMIDDGEPFERIADGIILHPFHSHHLRLEIIGIAYNYDESKYCRGCSLPIYQGQIYSCMECDYILHESCANAPRMIRHPLHPQPLTLYQMRLDDGPYSYVIECSACGRDNAGFLYGYSSVEFGNMIWLDLRCASIIEHFEYQGHEHPLFLPWNPEESARCQICKEEREKLICLKCDYTICFRCVTLPYKVRYKHDSHFLMVCDVRKEASDDQPYWCEICEGKIDHQVKEEYIWNNDEKKERRFYKCNDCCTTLHVECLLGVDIYLKSGKIIKSEIMFMNSGITQSVDVQILLNTCLSRPICYECNRRCPFPIYFKMHFRDFCSWFCTTNSWW